jgi:hypothetical protein
MGAETTGLSKVKSTFSPFFAISVLSCILPSQSLNPALGLGVGVGGEGGGHLSELVRWEEAPCFWEATSRRKFQFHPVPAVSRELLRQSGMLLGHPCGERSVEVTW